MNKKANRTICVLGLMLAAAVPVFAAADMIPCAQGNRWEFDAYKITRVRVQHQGQLLASVDDASCGASVYEITSADTKSNPAVFEYKESSALKSISGTDDTSTVELKLSSDKSALKILSSYQESASNNKPDKQSYEPPLFYYDKNAVPGKNWEVGVMRDGDTKSPTTARATGRETVTVPAGTFKDCLKVVYTSDDVTGTIDVWGKAFNITSGRTRGVYWVADGVGVVKELEISTSACQADGPDGKPITIDAATSEVNELKPGYIAK